MKNVVTMIMVAAVTIKRLNLFIIFFAIFHISVMATPSSLFWTICTTDVVETGNLDITVENYFSVYNRRGHGSYEPIDFGLEFGLFTWKDFAVEAGVDYYGGTDDPFYFNAKVGVEEDKIRKGFPSFSFGVFNMGTRAKGEGKTNQNIIDVVIGKTLSEKNPVRLFLGAYEGSKALGKNQAGFLIGIENKFCSEKYEDKEYYKWIFSADYASGKNQLGGGGVALTYFFYPNVSLQTGPVFFNTTKYNGSWKWSIQIDIVIPYRC